MINTTDTFVPGIDDREARVAHGRRDARNALDRTAEQMEWLAAHDEHATRPAWARAAELLRDIEAHGIPRADAPLPPPPGRRPPNLVVLRA